MSVCDFHAEVLAANLRAISGHRRRKINAAIRRLITKSCPQCIAATKESK